MRQKAGLLLNQGLSYNEVAERLTQEFGLKFTHEKVRHQYRLSNLDFERPPAGLAPLLETEFVENGNTAIATIRNTPNPKTLKELIRACEIDLDIWEVDHYIQNKWGGAMKGKDGLPIHYPLYQVKAWLIRKIPIKQLFPAVKPLTVPQFKIHAPAIVRNIKFHKVLTIPDSQMGFYRNPETMELEPFHDRRALHLTLQVAKLGKPDIIILLGDMLDLSEWSDKFPRGPEMYFTTQPALNELNWWIQQLLQTGAHIIYFEGNHEVRLKRMLKKNLIAAYNIKAANEPESPQLISIPAWLGLDKLGVEYLGDYPMAQYWINDNLRASHGNLVRAKSGDSVRALVQDARNSEICGHIHRFEMASKTVHPISGPVTYVAFSPGTVARLETGVVPSSGPRMNWQQGAGEVLYESGNGLFQITPLSINNGNMLYYEKHLVYDPNIHEIVNEAVSLK